MTTFPQFVAKVILYVVAGFNVYAGAFAHVAVLSTTVIGLVHPATDVAAAAGAEADGEGEVAATGVLGERCAITNQAMAPMTTTAPVMAPMICCRCRRAAL
jgi:hypothetical protein